MRKEKFTKGPWRVGPVDDTLVMDANRDEIAQALGDHEGEDWESVYANAALISAAPDLYEALKITLEQAIGCFQNHYGEAPTCVPEPDYIQKARAALAKAVVNHETTT